MRRLRCCLGLVCLLGITGCAGLHDQPPATPNSPPAEPTRAPAAERDPALDLLDYAYRLDQASPETRAQSVAQARDVVRRAPGARAYARLAIAFGTPEQTRYTPDEAARYAQLALSANDAAWSDAARQYLSGFARQYGEITRVRNAREDAPNATDGRPSPDQTREMATGAPSDNARIQALEAELDEARRKLRELADIESRLNTERP